MTTQKQNEDTRIPLNLTAEHYQEYFRRYPDRVVYLQNIILEDHLKAQQEEIKELKALASDK